MKYIHWNKNIFSVTKIIGLIENGVTFPILCVLDDGGKAVVKYQRNPCGTAVLINEFVGNCLADFVGLNIPEFGICNLDIDTNVDAEIFELDSNNAGLAFCSHFLSDVTPANRELLEKVSNPQTELLILFDYLIKNEDRHIGNLLCPVNSLSELYFIDCSHFLTMNGNLNNQLNMSYELSEDGIKNINMLSAKSRPDSPNVYHMMTEINFDNDKLITHKEQIKEKYSSKILAEIFDSIPEEWISTNMKIRISNMKEILDYRFSHIDNICSQILLERNGMI